MVYAGKAPRIYIATMQPFDQESLRRIEKHRRRPSERVRSTCAAGAAS
ncbi:MAG: hypothetical protein SPF38_03610 [Dysosmobacter sp.]|nr:hypothetical protein [Dysosmobacter sp.]MDY5612215.1 hypothetical protein [Dysosmobacter sp.]